MTASRLCADRWIVRAASRSSGASGRSARISAMAMTPFSGVRISWLIVARNALLAWLAASASSRASTSSRVRSSTSSTRWSRCRASSSASRFRSVMSSFTET